MKALVLTQASHLEYRDVATPAIGPDEVLVNVRACGICGSDIHGMDGSSGRRIPPVIMGHEAAGSVISVGPDVVGWQPGDRVTFDSTIYCGTCWFCQQELINLCDRRRVLGVSCTDYRRDGAFAEYVAVPQHVLYRLPAEVDFIDAAMTEPLSVALHAVRQAAIGPGIGVAVIGTGIIGLLICEVLRASGCDHVLAVDKDPGRLDLAVRLGASGSVVADGPETAARIRECFEGRGPDVVFEAVGIDPTVGLASEAVRKGGTIVLVGNLAPSVSLPLQSIVTRQITMRGSAASSGEYPACLEMIAERSVDVRALISAVAPLQDGAEWFGRLRRGDGQLLKVVLEP